MAKVLVSFTLHSTTAKESFEAEGILSDQRLSFMSPALERHTVFFTPDGLTYTKQGKQRLQLVFNAKKLSNGVIEDDDVTMRFRIKTDCLHREKDRIAIDYTLHQDDESFHQGKIRITWSAKGGKQ